VQRAGAISAASSTTSAAASQSASDAGGYRVEYGGQFESQQSASTRAGPRSSRARRPVHAAGAAHSDVRDALLIMVNLPLALIGGVAGVFLAGGVLSVASMIGFITLFGIATRNGIMLVSHIQHLMTERA
jgi:Cu/Ag efflux pump CusA